MTLKICRAPAFALLVAATLAAGCEPPNITVPGASLSGQVRITAALRPLLPPAAGASGRNVNEVEPNTVPPVEFFDAGAVEPDTAPLIISGTMDASDIRDRIIFRTTAAASVTLTFEVTGGGGQTGVFLVNGPAILDDNSNILAVEDATGSKPIS